MYIYVYIYTHTNVYIHIVFEESHAVMQLLAGCVYMYIKHIHMYI